MGSLDSVIGSEDWDKVAYMLAIAVLRVAESIPPESLSALLALLSEGGDDWDE